MILNSHWSYVAQKQVIAETESQFSLLQDIEPSSDFETVILRDIMLLYIRLPHHYIVQIKAAARNFHFYGDSDAPCGQKWYERHGLLKILF